MDAPNGWITSCAESTERPDGKKCIYLPKEYCRMPSASLTPNCVWPMGQGQGMWDEFPGWPRSGKQCEYYWDFFSGWTQGYVHRPRIGEWSCRKYTGKQDERCTSSGGGGVCGPAGNLAQNNCDGNVSRPNGQNPETDRCCEVGDKNGMGNNMPRAMSTYNQCASHTS